HHGDAHQQAADRDRARDRFRESVALHPPLPRRLRRYALADPTRRPPPGWLNGKSPAVREPSCVKTVRSPLLTRRPQWQATTFKPRFPPCAQKLPSSRRILANAAAKLTRPSATAPAMPWRPPVPPSALQRNM